MQITLDVNQPLTAVEKSILRTLLGENESSAPTTVVNNTTVQEAPVVTEDPEDAPTKESVAALAAALVTGGEREKVKAALDTVGAKRIRELTDEQVTQIHGLLS